MVPLWNVTFVACTRLTCLRALSRISSCSTVKFWLISMTILLTFMRVVVGLFKTCLDPRGLRVWQRRSISSDCYLSAGPSVPQTRGGSGCDREIDCRGMGYGAACGRHGDGVGSQVGLVERPDTEDRCG